MNNNLQCNLFWLNAQKFIELINTVDNLKYAGYEKDKLAIEKLYEIFLNSSTKSDKDMINSMCLFDLIAKKVKLEIAHMNAVLDDEKKPSTF